MKRQENLIPLNERTKEEQRKIAQKGGQASGEARRKRKRLAEYMEIALSLEPDREKVDELLGMNIDTENIDNAMFMTMALMQKAQDGDTRAFEIIRDTVGEKPTDKLQLGGEVEVNDARTRLLEKLIANNAAE